MSIRLEAKLSECNSIIRLTRINSLSKLISLTEHIKLHTELESIQSLYVMFLSNDCYNLDRILEYNEF